MASTLQPLEGITPVRRPLGDAVTTGATAVTIVSVRNDPNTTPAKEHRVALEVRCRRG